MRQLYTIILAMTLSACQPSEFIASEAFSTEGVTFSVQANPTESCEPGATYSAHVSWSVTDMDDPKLDIRIGSSVGPLPASVEQAKSSFDTDPWVVEGTWFLLIDRRSASVLATAQAPAARCQH